MRFMFLGPCGPSCGPDDDFEDRETIRKKMSAKRMRCSEIIGTSHATNQNPKQLPNNKVLGWRKSYIPRPMFTFSSQKALLNISSYIV